jgi:2-oxoglutarate dehydrogenase E1 component
VPEAWRYFFEGVRFASGGDLPARAPAVAAPGEAPDPEQMLRQAKVEALKYRYRDLGHLLACMDPLEACPTEHPLLALGAFGLETADLERSFFTRRFASERSAPLKDILRALKETYCRSVGVEYMHIQDPGERRWLQDRMEPDRNRPDLSGDERRRILELVVHSDRFEKFLNRKYVGVTRFSLEGGDGVIPMLDEVVRRAAGAGCREVVLGMAHRGRLNVQHHLLGKPLEDIFSEFEHCYDPDALVGAGDVKYHNGFLNEIETVDGHTVRMLLVNNPSHLEAVDPVAQGLARGRQEALGGPSESVLPLLLHGDAAFAGQGVVAETLNMSQLEGYTSGGTVHLVINNQIGYTTLPEDARSTRYSTDVAKMLMVPVFHVHGENPEALIQVARLAVDYRMAFGKDVVIDVICYRRFGHNEGDEPYFTQPLLYERIRRRPSLARLYGDRLMAERLVDEGFVDGLRERADAELAAAYDEIHGSVCLFPENRFLEIWDRYGGRLTDQDPDTDVSEDRLLSLAERLHQVPDGFELNQKLVRIMKRRQQAVTEGAGIDWATAESLAFGSLLVEGHPIRLSGQDSARGTFSQRHSVWWDIASGQAYAPLNNLATDQAAYRVYNSLLAEYGVMGFEYGYSLARPDVLTLWEAQFGDFANNAQAVIDLFIASGESKWQRQSGLVLLLPHGFEGQGPEHSSARLERFLQLCAEDNMQICYPSTPAQYFHLLRRQVLRKVRKPLVVMTPKSLLRNPNAVSERSELAGGRFEEALGDRDAGRKVRRVLFCSGKIFYELAERRRLTERDDTALLRLEQLYPFPEERLTALLSRFRSPREWFWVQEEPENMGGWWFVRPRLEALAGKRLDYIGRPPASSPATGFPKIFRRQQDAILDQALGPLIEGKHVS